MSRRARRETFAEVVAKVEAAPAVTRRVRPGVADDGQTWGDPDGNEYTLSDGDLDPARATELVAQGALVVYDSCGCGGSCGSELDWIDAEGRDELAGADPPRVGFRKKTWGWLAEWRSDSGLVLVEAAVNVRWGSRIDG